MSLMCGMFENCDFSILSGIIIAFGFIIIWELHKIRKYAKKGLEE